MPNPNLLLVSRQICNRTFFVLQLQSPLQVIINLLNAVSKIIHRSTNFRDAMLESKSPLVSVPLLQLVWIMQRENLTLYSNVIIFCHISISIVCPRKKTQILLSPELLQSFVGNYALCQYYTESIRCRRFETRISKKPIACFSIM